MRTINTTDQFGPNGLEITFYTGEDVGEDILLELPNLNTQTHSALRIMTYTITPMDYIGFVGLLHQINTLADNIYTAQKASIIEHKISLDAQQPLNSMRMAVHSVYPQMFVQCTARLLSYAVMTQSYHLKIKENISITFDAKELFQKNREGDKDAKIVWDAIFKHNNHVDLFSVFLEMNDIFYSGTMFAAASLYSPDIATVCAIETPFNQPYSYVYHNHSLRQLVKGLKNFISDHFNDFQLPSKAER